MPCFAIVDEITKKPSTDCVNNVQKDIDVHAFNLFFDHVSRKWQEIDSSGCPVIHVILFIYICGSRLIFCQLGLAPSNGAPEKGHTT